MSENLPAVRSRELSDQIMPDRSNGKSAGLRDWISSPLGRAAAQALPDVLRMANRNREPQQQSLVSQIMPSSDGASGVTLSEVDVDVDIPFVRRLTIRSASSWSISPQILLAKQREKRRTRWKLRALAAGMVGVAGVILARRSGVSLPARLNPAASVPFLAAGATPVSTRTDNENPGNAD